MTFFREGEGVVNFYWTMRSNFSLPQRELWLRLVIDFDHPPTYGLACLLRQICIRDRCTLLQLSALGDMTHCDYGLKIENLEK